ncbi:MAG: nucleotide sugar epimerase [Chloroflexi bacterium HGW-Chloroflexi-1]|nr:MAG: nucleotide sugar epimerase [Chloroflexi bacterium HGW-Chloroflexi-1]
MALSTTSNVQPANVQTILVTGVAGFIGAKVAELLLVQGHTVVGVDNLNEAYDVRLKRWRLAQLEGKPGFGFRRLDICVRDSLRELFDPQSAIHNPQFDAVINLAARAGVRYSVENPWVYFETNVTGTLNLLELCRQYGVKKFVLASSSSVYGNGTQLPYREDQPTDQPLSPYAASKKAAEAVCYTYHYLHGLDITVFRYFTVYGPAGRPDMMPFRLAQWVSEGRPVTVYGDGTQSRDFTYVDDIARGTIAGLKPLASPQAREGGREGDRKGGYEVINLGSDRPVVLMDAIRLVEELTGKRAQVVHKPMHPADVWATWADIGKAERLLGWRPQAPFRDGMARLVAWYQANRDWAKDVPTG